MQSLLLADDRPTGPHEVVARLLAVQAQDYGGALWAIGLRARGSTVADVEAAIERREIVRTWPMRGTLHFAAAEDVRWLQPLLAPRVLARAQTRERQLGLDERTFARAREIFSATLEDGRLLARPEAICALEAAGVATDGQRGYHVLWRLAQEGLLVLGPMVGKQQTFALLDEWVPAERCAHPPTAPREELLAIVAERYFRGHGPATVADLARWAGIPKREAAAALDAIAQRLETAEHAGERFWFSAEAATGALSGAAARPRRAELLPPFDEYLIGYADHVAQLGAHHEAYRSTVASNGMVSRTLLVDGRIAGTWKRTLAARSVSISVAEFETLGPEVDEAVQAAQRRYARFVGKELR
jgi:hypothetical protein